MIRWCSYCFSYLGQIEPLAELSVSHGACDACLAKGVFDVPEADAGLAALRALYGRLRGLQSDRMSRNGDASALIAEAQALGLKPADILLAMVQPALYQVGCDFESGSISVADEHAFTVYCERVLAVLSADVPLGAPAAGGRLDALLVCAEDNHHQLGLQVVELLLRQQGRTVVSVRPGLPDRELADLLARWQPKVLGLSLSMPAHWKSLAEAQELVKAMGPSAPHLLAGGRALLEPQKGPWPHVQFIDPLLGTRETLDALEALF